MSKTIDIAALNSEIRTMEEELAKKLTETITEEFVDEFESCIDGCTSSVKALQGNISSCNQQISETEELLEKSKAEAAARIAELNDELRSAGDEIAKKLTGQVADKFVVQFDSCLGNCTSSVQDLLNSISRCQQQISETEKSLEESKAQVACQAKQLQSDLARSAKLIAEVNENNETQLIVENTKKLQDEQKKMNEQIAAIQKRTKINTVLMICAVVLLAVILIGRFSGFM